MVKNKNLTEEQLAAEIKKHNKLYWEQNIPEISDEEYDELVQALEEINPDNSVLIEIGAAKVASLGKVNLDEPMISLDKTYYFKDADIPGDKKGKKSLLKWASENKRSSEELFLIQPKYDGISAIYTNGILATRGQGTEEENVSDKIPLIELETKGYKGPLDRSIRGEIIIRDDDFKLIYSNITKVDGKPYKNSRNAVGGIMGLKDITTIKSQGAKLTLVDYDMISYSVKFSELETKWEGIVEEIESLPYPMDGIVVKLADKQYRESLGYTAHHPRGQIAFKFSGVRKKTKLIDVVWSFGKKCLTPVGKIEPIDIGGVTITNVTLHNIDMVQKNDWKIGDVITVERAGDVIPHIVDSEPGEYRIDFLINTCPSCGNELVIENKELRCINPDCFEIKLQRILAAVKNIGIEELGEPNIRKMMVNLGVNCLKNIFDLKPIDLAKLEGFKEKSINNLYNNIQAAKNTTDFQLLAALNIEGVGQVTAQKILRNYTLSELRNMSQIQLSFIPEIGPETSSKLYSALKEKSDTIDDLLETLIVKKSKTSEEANKLICFDFETGKLQKPMKHYEKLLLIHKYNRIKPVQVDQKIFIPENLEVLVTTRSKESKTRLLTKTRELNILIVTPEEWETSLPELEKEIIEQEEKTICFTGKMPEKRSYYENIAIKRNYKPVETVGSSLHLLVAVDPTGSSSKIKKAKKNGIVVISLDEWLSKGFSGKNNKVQMENQEHDMLPGF